MREAVSLEGWDPFGALPQQIPQAANAPPSWDLAQLGVLEVVWEEVGEGLREAGVAAVGLGADGVEVHEPRLEERSRHRFQRLAHPPVQLDLVVERAENVGDSALFAGREGSGHLQPFNVGTSDAQPCCARL